VMDDVLLTTGIPSREQIESRVPPKERREKGPFVVIECFQEIPCDPCYHSCRFGGGICVGSCPGLAIFVVDETFSETECLIALPYEFIPLPAKGGEVLLLNRAGEEVGKGKVHIVVPGKKPAGTSVIWVRAPKELSMEVRNVKVLTEGGARCE